MCFLAGQKDAKRFRTVDLHKTGRSTKKLIVQQALNTEDMDQEQFLTKTRQRIDRSAECIPPGNAFDDPTTCDCSSSWRPPCTSHALHCKLDAAQSSVAAVPVALHTQNFIGSRQVTLQVQVTLQGWH